MTSRRLGRIIMFNVGEEVICGDCLKLGERIYGLIKLRVNNKKEIDPETICDRCKKECYVPPEKLDENYDIPLYE